MPTILVLEDDVSNLQAICAILTSMGFRVLEATNGKQAIETANKQADPIDLFVSDIGLPDLSGTEVALRILQLQPDLSVLFLSGMPLDYWPEGDQRNLQQLPPDSVEFLEKPFRASALQGKVENLVHGRFSAAGARR